MEVLDLYDENRTKLSKTINRTNTAKLNDNEFFIYVQCWIINSENHILLTKRKLEKENGGKWEATGGCVKRGESSIQAMTRELYEEIGLTVLENDLKLLKTIKECKRYRNCFRDIYLLKKNINIRDLKFIDGEVIDAKFVTIEKFKNMINNNEINSYLSFFIDEYYNNI